MGTCGGDGYCGTCIQKAIDARLPPLSSCGNYIVYAQMDQASKGDCIFPQIEFLDELYEESPNAIFILPFRNVSAWIKSVQKWHGMRKRFDNGCDVFFTFRYWQ